MQIIRRIKRSIKGENKFRKVANEWLEYKKNSIKNSTYYNYKFIIEKYLNKEFGEQNVEKIKDYNQYILHSGPKVHNHLHFSIHASVSQNTHSHPLA